MKSYNSLESYSARKAKSVITIGSFDGVHIGHQSILKKIISYSKTHNCESVVLTFFPHPRMVLQGNNTLKLLNTIKEKTKLFSNIGINSLIIHPFDKEFSRLTAEEFVKDVLVDKLNIQKIIIGYDHRFGRNRSANIEDLIEFGEKYNFEVEEISAQEISEISVSSTKIRNYLNAGEIELSNRFLGYPYFITGKVVKGNQIGRTINFPTANLTIEENYKLIPKNGVYIVSSIIENTNYFGMANIGVNPTVSGTEQKIEIHFFDFNKNLYNLEIQVNFHHRIREEIKFDSLEALKSQLKKDETISKEFIKHNLC
uniref:bifunctional riboflavin kinase/FAD synthetase n=1 Tax=Flavobacterium sp. TaxID=239 RepID=UPI00404B6D35